MGQNNGTRPKLELEPGEEAKVTLLRDKPATGKSDFGPYNAYSVAAEDGTEMVFFATPDIHQIIEEQRLGKGSQLILRRPVQTNGRKPKLEIALLGSESASSKVDEGDQLKGIMQQCLEEAVQITKSVAGIPFQNEDVRAICSCLFIARTR